MQAVLLAVTEAGEAQLLHDAKKEPINWNPDKEAPAEWLTKVSPNGPTKSKLTSVGHPPGALITIRAESPLHNELLSTAL